MIDVHISSMFLKTHQSQSFKKNVTSTVMDDQETHKSQTGEKTNIDDQAQVRSIQKMYWNIKYIWCIEF